MPEVCYTTIVSPPQLRWINLTVAHKICPVILVCLPDWEVFSAYTVPLNLAEGAQCWDGDVIAEDTFSDGFVLWWGTMALQKLTTWQGKIICSTKLRMMQDHHAFLKAWFYAVFFTLQTQACRTWLFVWCLLSNFGSRLKCWRNASHQRNPASFYILQLPMPGNCQFTCSSQTSCFLSCRIDAFDSSSPWPTTSKQEEELIAKYSMRFQICLPHSMPTPSICSVYSESSSTLRWCSHQSQPQWILKMVIGHLGQNAGIRPRPTGTAAPVCMWHSFLLLVRRNGMPKELQSFPMPDTKTFRFFLDEPIWHFLL